MKRILITEKQYKTIINNYSIIEQTENEKIFSKFLDMIKSYSKSNTTTPEKSSDTFSPSESDYTSDELSKKFVSPLKNVSVPGGDYGKVRAGLDAATKPHPGVDMPTPSGTEVHSPADGVVIDSAIRADACGGTLFIDHKNGYKSRYCHLKEINVKIGDSVKQGQVVALTGGGGSDKGRGLSTGPHLHFEMYRDGALINPASAYN